MKPHHTLRIAGASGFWGDSAIATPQLLHVPDLDFLVYDYLAETTMSIMARARARDPSAGYATDFVTDVIAPHLQTIKDHSVRVVSNAGGLNPTACRDAILAVARAEGIDIRVAVVTGDDLMDHMAQLRNEDLREMFQGEPLPEHPLSANAYLGARAIAAALDAGAEIVITGRCVDRAVVLGALVHHFHWSWTDWNRLAAGTLAGHVIECGAQATGGLFTDWKDVPGWDCMGYPVIDCADDGSFILSKPQGTGGLIHPGAVSEQILYEVGDPASYVMPDVVCDWTRVKVQAIDTEHVRVSGACGRAATASYKCNATWQDGYQLGLMLAIRGIDAPAKARKTADALLARTRHQMHLGGFADYSETVVELLGCESLYGDQARHLPTREVVLRIAVRHAESKALKFLQKECASSGTSMGPGTRSSFFGRSDIQQVIKVFSFLLPKTEVDVAVDLDGVARAVAVLPGVVHGQPHEAADATEVSLDTARDILAELAPDAVHLGVGLNTTGLVTVPLVAVAWARSGDKGDEENIGVIARTPECLPWLRAQLTAERVGQTFSHLVLGPVQRYDVPGLHALNFVLQRALGGGGSASLRSDPLGKSYAQMLLDIEVRVPADLVRHVT